MSHFMYHMMLTLLNFIHTYIVLCLRGGMQTSVKTLRARPLPLRLSCEHNQQRQGEDSR